ncbi:MAG: helicase HerA-like domain-containing protein, partial [Gemmataceae bacterium]
MTEPFDIEQPASFYLGREYDLATKSVRADRPPVMYDARDLLTHGVVVGMTGSGKTGLCINLLEEAAIDGIPCIIIDVKGDLTNLLLQFPELTPADFKKWLNPEDARLKKLSLDEYATQLADRWKQGLEETLQTDPGLNSLLQSIVGYSPTVYDVAIADTDGHPLLHSDPQLVRCSCRVSV